MAHLGKSTSVLGVVCACVALMLGFAGAQGSSGSEWEVLGGQTYSSMCSSCHQGNGLGVTAAFPPLAEHLPKIDQLDGGRDHLIRAVLFGLQGEIHVDGQTFNGAMPAWGGALSDEQVAAVLNHELTSWGNATLYEAEFVPIVPEDVAAHRGDALSAAQVYEMRQQVEGIEGEAGAGDAVARVSTTAGVYTEEQAARGHEVYNSKCATCHGGTLTGSESGPPLKGPYFNLTWGGRSVAELYGFIRANMPVGVGTPGSLRDEQYIDIVARILQVNEFPAGGDELATDATALQGITIEKR